MGRKILLADDSITIQKVVNLTFSDEGIEVITVGNGELAVRRMNEVRPDLVLADIYMPGKSGYEVCEFVKNNPQFAHIPVLLLVGAFEPFDPAEATRVKADGHLTKPFESRALVAVVNKLLANAPVVAPFSSVPVASPVPPPWQPIPPDATTTKLSPEVAEMFEANFASEHKKPEPFRASPVTPIQASPVTPIQASPVTPIQASPMFEDVKASSPMEKGFSAPEPTVSYSSSPNFVDNVFSFDNKDNDGLSKINAFSGTLPVEEPSKSKEPVFDLDAPPEPTFELDLSDISYNTSERKASNVTHKDAPMSNETTSSRELSFELTPVEQEIEQPTNFEIQDDYESTRIMGSASRKELMEAYSVYSDTSQESSSQQENVSDAQYDDFMPLDLEPLEDTSYTSRPIQSTATDELPAISDEYVLESITSEIKREPLLDIEDLPSATNPMPTMAYPPASVPSYSANEEVKTGRITDSHPRITETMPQISEHELEHQQEENVQTVEVQTASPTLPVFELEPENPIEEETKPSSYTPFQEEPLSDVFSEPVNLQDNNYNLGSSSIEEPPSQLELEQALPEYYMEQENTDVEDPLGDLVTTPEELQPSESVSEQTVFHQEPSIDVSLPITPIVAGTTTVGLAVTSLVAAPSNEEEETSSSDLSQPLAEEIQEPAPTRPVRKSEAPTIPAMPALPMPSVAEVVPAVPIGAPVVITSIDQIPQHLVDEIVRRVVTQLSENVIREIAWEVVPDLAQIMIKKQLSQTSGK